MTHNSDHGYRTDTVTGTAPIPVRVPIWNLRSGTGTAPIPVTGTAPIPLYINLLSAREGQGGRQALRFDGSRWRCGADASDGRKASPHYYAHAREQRPPDCLEQALGPFSGKALKRRVARPHLAHRYPYVTPIRQNVLLSHICQGFTSYDHLAARQRIGIRRGRMAKSKEDRSTMAGRPKTRAREQARQEAAQGTEKPTQATRGNRQASDSAQQQSKPVRRSESVVQEMLWRIAGDARSLRDVCKDADMPSYRTAYDWLNADPDLRARYEMARAERGDFHGEQVLEIARQVREGELDPQAGKVAMDGVKWSAGRMAPKAWGDRSQLDMNVSRDPGDDHVSAVLELAERKKQRPSTAPAVPVAWKEDEADEGDVPDDVTRH